ncbi:hypothetical protein HDE_00924 [Halotydeus destructor]|nr:hypothetical protein HDE_00924 [Halotydeus destructor]
MVLMPFLPPKQDAISARITDLQDVSSLDIVMQKLPHLKTLRLQFCQFFTVTTIYNELKALIAKYPLLHITIILPQDADFAVNHTDLHDLLKRIRVGTLGFDTFSKDPFPLLRTCSHFQDIHVLMPYLSIYQASTNGEVFPNVKTLKVFSNVSVPTVDVDALFKMFPHIDKLLVHFPQSLSIQKDWNLACNNLTIRMIKPTNFPKILPLLRHAIPYLKTLSIRVCEQGAEELLQLMADSRIQHLDLSGRLGNKRLKQNFFAMIDRCPLETLMIPSIKLNLEEVGRLFKTNSTIQRLRLGRLDWGDDSSNKRERFIAVLPAKLAGQFIYVSRNTGLVNFDRYDFHLS